MKKPSGDIIILEKCTKNQDHMLYCSMTDVIVIFHFGLFLPFYHRNSQKNQNLKKSEKKKKSLEISSFYQCVPKIMIRWCTVPEKWCTTDGWTEGKSDT